MTCQRCQTINPQGAVACAACGAPLVAMPMQPGYAPPGQPYMVMQPMMAPRSGIPKTMGILMIVFASLGLLATFANLASDPSKDNPILAELDGWSSLKTMILVFGVIDLGIGGLHLYAGVRSVGYKQNGPGLAVAYAISRIVITVVTLVAVYAWMKPMLDVIPGASSAVIGTFIAAAVISAIWPIIVLALMTRPAAKAACQG